MDKLYFGRKLSFIIRDLHSYTAPELARELVRLARTADEAEAVRELTPSPQPGTAEQQEQTK